IYQGRFKSFPIQEGDHLLAVCRYVERNALRANLVPQAQKWRWSSLWHREHQTQVPWLSDWPTPIPAKWTAYVNRPESEAELRALRRCVWGVDGMGILFGRSAQPQPWPWSRHYVSAGDHGRKSVR